MRNRLKPVQRKTEEEILNETKEKEAEDILGLDSEHLTEDASLEFYEKAEINETKNEFADSDREEMSKQILSLRNEIESLKSENENLRSQLSEMKSKTEKSPKPVISEGEMESLKNKNSFLTLKSNNLEIEVNRLNEVVKTQQATIDSFKHVYTKPNYNPDFTVRGTNMNGYQDWR